MKAWGLGFSAQGLGFRDLRALQLKVWDTLGWLNWSMRLLEWSAPVARRGASGSLIDAAPKPRRLNSLGFSGHTPTSLKS